MVSTLIQPQALRVCWILSSAGEALIAATAAQAMAEQGIESVFTAWTLECSRYLYDQGIHDVTYVPTHLPPARLFSFDELDALDRRYSPPGIGLLAYAEMRAFYRKDRAELLPLTLRYLDFWETFLTDHQIDALITWTSSNLACRSAWTVAKSRGLPALIIGTGPSFDYFTLADIDENIVGSELVEAMQSDEPRVVTTEQREAVLKLVSEVTETHAKFKPRPVTKIPPPIASLRWQLGIALRKLGIRPELSVPTWQPTPECLARYPDNPDEAESLKRISDHLKWRRWEWAWLTYLKVLRYTQPNFDEPFIYFPMQQQVGARLAGQNPFYADQVDLAMLAARAVPPGYKLYVKEHPTHPGTYDWRALRKLQRLSNVELIDPHADTVQLIRKAKAVIVVSSTTGWEGFLWRVPVVALGKTFYTCTDLIFRADTLQDLPAKLRAALNAGSKLYEDRYDEWLWFIWQTMDKSWRGSPFRYKNLFGTLAAKANAENGRMVGTAIATKLISMMAKEAPITRGLNPLSEKL